MRRIVFAAAAAAALAISGAAMSRVAQADATGPSNDVGAGADLNRLQHVSGLRNCWYNRGWHDPGWHWCRSSGWFHVNKGRDIDAAWNRWERRHAESGREARRGQAVIKAFGEPVRRVGRPPGPPPPSGRGGDWAELGCQQVSLSDQDHDSIRIGRREGRFKAIRLLARDSDVEMLDLKVIYANGDPDDIAVQHFIRAGERTRPLDLKGWERSIDRVDVVYRTAPNPVDIVARQRISTATVCVEGLQ